MLGTFLKFLSLLGFRVALPLFLIGMVSEVTSPASFLVGCLWACWVVVAVQPIKKIALKAP